MKKNYEVVLCLDVTGDMCTVIKEVCQKEFDYLSLISDKIRAQADGGGSFGYGRAVQGYPI